MYFRIRFYPDNKDIFEIEVAPKGRRYTTRIRCSRDEMRTLIATLQEGLMITPVICKGRTLGNGNHLKCGFPLNPKEKECYRCGAKIPNRIGGK